LAKPKVTVSFEGNWGDLQGKMNIDVVNLAELVIQGKPTKLDVVETKLDENGQKVTETSPTADPDPKGEPEKKSNTALIVGIVVAVVVVGAAVGIGIFLYQRSKKKEVGNVQNPNSATP
jgi:hypothetical protein